MRKSAGLIYQAVLTVSFMRGMTFVDTFAANTVY